MTQKTLDDLTYVIIGCAIEVHSGIGPGLLESVYQHCLAHEMRLQGVRFQKEQHVPIAYKDLKTDAVLRCDFLVDEAIVVEVKAVKELLPIHEAQLMTYMNLLDKPKGILINFCVTNIFHHGQKTRVNKLYAQLPKE